MKTLGICFGATTVQYVKLNAPKAASGGAGDAAKIEATGRVAHEGDPKGVALKLLSDPALSGVDRVAVTGRAFRSSVDLSAISEPEAVERALRQTYPDGAARPRLVISSGGETQLVYVINTKGGVSSVHSGNKCASGTGEFFLQQIRRTGLKLECKKL